VTGGAGALPAIPSRPRYQRGHFL